MNGVEDGLYQSEGLRCLYLEGLVLTQLEILIFSRVSASDPDRVTLCIVVECLHSDNTIESLLDIGD